MPFGTSDPTHTTDLHSFVSIAFCLATSLVIAALGKKTSAWRVHRCLTKGNTNSVIRHPSIQESELDGAADFMKPTVVTLGILVSLHVTEKERRRGHLGHRRFTRAIGLCLLYTRRTRRHTSFRMHVFEHWILINSSLPATKLHMVSYPTALATFSGRGRSVIALRKAADALHKTSQNGSPNLGTTEVDISSQNPRHWWSGVLHHTSPLRTVGGPLGETGRKRSIAILTPMGPPPPGRCGGL